MGWETYDAKVRQRRPEVLALPTVGLRRHGWVPYPAHELRVWARGPERVGVGPGGELVAFWPSANLTDPRGVVVTTWTGTVEDRACVVVTDLDSVQGAGRYEVSFVQPLPEGQLLLSASRSKPNVSSAGIWDAGGVLTRTANLGDAIQHLLSTPTGRIWAGYFDEAPGGPGPSGVALFDPDLREAWRYEKGMPDHFDCYALNVDGEVATSYAYTVFHLTRLENRTWRDLGPAPHRSAHTLLVQGRQAALIGGSSAEYDLVTPLRLDGGGITQAGPLQRLVLPDGLEVTRTRFFARGADLHAVHGRGWHRLDLGDLLWD